MKHTWKITSILIIMFIFAQIIGLAVINQYSPVNIVVTTNQTSYNQTVYNLPYGFEPPQQNGKVNLVSIVISFALAITLLLLLMKYKIDFFLKIWFATVIVLALSISIFSFIRPLQYSLYISIGISLILAYFKIVRRNLIFHNLTELLIYPGIAAIFVPLLSVSTTIVLLILISVYDMYAVWHAKFMQKMAKYQIKNLKIFSGFFIPYAKKEDLQKSKKSKNKKLRITIAILGGGDIVFPIIFSGVLLHTGGWIPAIFVSIGATLSLFGLFLLSEKGRFYPAMPFITAGCFIGLLVSYFI